MLGPNRFSRVDDTTDLICENIRRKLSGRPLLNRVDKRLGFPETGSRTMDPSTKTQVILLPIRLTRLIPFVERWEHG